MERLRTQLLLSRSRGAYHVPRGRPGYGGLGGAGPTHGGGGARARARAHVLRSARSSSAPSPARHSGLLIAGRGGNGHVRRPPLTGRKRPASHPRRRARGWHRHAARGSEPLRIAPWLVVRRIRNLLYAATITAAVPLMLPGFVHHPILIRRVPDAASRRLALAALARRAPPRSPRRRSSTWVDHVSVPAMSVHSSAQSPGLNTVPSRWFIGRLGGPIQSGMSSSPSDGRA